MESSTFLSGINQLRVLDIDGHLSPALIPKVKCKLLSQYQ